MKKNYLLFCNFKGMRSVRKLDFPNSRVNKLQGETIISSTTKSISQVHWHAHKLMTPKITHLKLLITSPSQASKHIIMMKSSTCLHNISLSLPLLGLLCILGAHAAVWSGGVFKIEVDSVD